MLGVEVILSCRTSKNIYSIYILEQQENNSSEINVYGCFMIDLAQDNQSKDNFKLYNDNKEGFLIKSISILEQYDNIYYIHVYITKYNLYLCICYIYK